MDMGTPLLPPQRHRQGAGAADDPPVFTAGAGAGASATATPAGADTATAGTNAGALAPGKELRLPPSLTRKESLEGGVLATKSARESGEDTEDGVIDAQWHSPHANTGTSQHFAHVGQRAHSSSMDAKPSGGAFNEFGGAGGSSNTPRDTGAAVMSPDVSEGGGSGASRCLSPAPVPRAA